MSTPIEASDEIDANRKSQSALDSAKRNFRYFLNPSTQLDRPAGLRTRALLRGIRYIGRFILWRLVRYSKAIVAGAIITAIGATAFGSVITGVAWIAVPTSITAVVASGTVWTLARWAVSRLRKRGAKTRSDVNLPQRRDEATRELPNSWSRDTGARAIPW